MRKEGKFTQYPKGGYCPYCREYNIEHEHSHPTPKPTEKCGECLFCLRNEPCIKIVPVKSPTPTPEKEKCVVCNQVHSEINDYIVCPPSTPVVEEWEFTECDTCKTKAGSPRLCSGCLKNRATIETLTSHREAYHKRIVEEINGVVNIVLQAECKGADKDEIVSALENLITNLK